ncbi:hypothetical protein HAX54_027210 [Datura stramonium]|uniref:Uncharacterized protein n=1 Tax=Datura stramonium TaxID=4076 RepID=A0ABS8RKN8_DATST|nr:hypothetical protein [Datura stramonium]
MELLEEQDIMHNTEKGREVLNKGYAEYIQDGCAPELKGEDFKFKILETTKAYGFKIERKLLGLLSVENFSTKSRTTHNESLVAFNESLDEIQSRCLDATEKVRVVVRNNDQPMHRGKIFVLILRTSHIDSLVTFRVVLGVVGWSLDLCGSKRKAVTGR